MTHAHRGEHDGILIVLLLLQAPSTTLMRPRLFAAFQVAVHVDLRKRLTAVFNDIRREILPILATFGNFFSCLAKNLSNEIYVPNFHKLANEGFGEYPKKVWQKNLPNWQIQISISLSCCQVFRNYVSLKTSLGSNGDGPRRPTEKYRVSFLPFFFLLCPPAAHSQLKMIKTHPPEHTDCTRILIDCE